MSASAIAPVRAVRRLAVAARSAPVPVRAAAVLAFAGQFVLLGAAFGLAQAPSSKPALAAGESLLVGAAVLSITHSRAARVIVALVAAVIVVVQTFVFRFVHAPLDIQVAEAALHAWPNVRGVVANMLPATAGSVLVVFVLELGLLEVAAVRAPPRAGFAIGLAAGAAVFFGVDPRHATPEIRGAHALRAFRGEPPRAVEGAVPLPALHPDRADVPSILFVLSESIRAEDYVHERGADATAPFTAELLDDRVDLLELRAVSSYTAVSLSAVLTAHSQEEPRETILAAPNVFDFAHAAGSWVGYYSAQSKETFETKDVRAAVDRFVTLETLAGREVEDDADLVTMPLDRILVDRFVAELPTARQPMVTMLHLYGTHAPYWFDDARARFTPFERSVAWSAMAKLRNAYRNAIVEQDREVARAVSAFIEHARGRPWIVVFTSDHGEAFGEHGAIHHGQNLYDEQIHVPAWIAWSAGALPADAIRALREHERRYVTHLDLLPTVLDAMGLWQNFATHAHTSRMGGRTLLRPWEARGPIAITNCTAMFRCPLNTWGVLADDHKLIAQAWDGGWRCLALGGGEHEAGGAACDALREASRARFALLPNGQPNR